MLQSKSLSDMSSVMEILLNRFEKLTPKEKKPARILLDNYPLGGLDTVAQFAQKSNVSGPTILRLISKLGFEGYAQFQKKLRQELQARLETPIEKNRSQNTHQVAGSEFIDEFSASVCQNITNSLANIPPSEINSVTQLLADANSSIFLLGGRYTTILAEHFYLHLHAIRPKIQCIRGQSSTWAESLLDIEKNDVLILFDIRRYQKNIEAFAQKAMKKGVKLILFTDQWFSPIAPLSHHVFSLQIEVPSNWDSSAAMMTLIDIILAKLTRDLWLDVKDRLESREKIFQSF